MLGGETLPSVDAILDGVGRALTHTCGQTGLSCLYLDHRTALSRARMLADG